MLRAHSLLYAVYVCLIVSILCAALLYFSNLYGQLNGYYNLRESLYSHNLSVVNFALGHELQPEEIPQNEYAAIQGNYQSKKFGLFSVLVCHSIAGNDTVSSAQLVGCYTQEKRAIHLANFSKPLSYFGKVIVTGDNFLPSTVIAPSYINNKPNQLMASGINTISDRILPKINSSFTEVFASSAQSSKLDVLEKTNDSIYFQSFFDETIQVALPKPILSKLVFKGNFILRSTDSIVVKNDAILEDIILMAPKIIFEEGFRGNVQAFATESIEVGSEVNLQYPSVLCVYNPTQLPGKILIKKKSKIAGGVVLFGNPLTSMAENNIQIEPEGLVKGALYCTGSLSLKSNVYGSVYTNKFFYKTESSFYENVISDIEINPLKLPDYFISLPLFESKKQSYGIIKKVL